MGMVTGEESSRQREPLCEEGARSLASLNLSFLICVVRIMAVSADPRGCCRGCRREALPPALASGEQSTTGAGEAWHRQDLRKWDPEGHKGTCSRDSRVTASNQRRRRNRGKMLGVGGIPPTILL